MNSKPPSYRGYRFPPEIISHAVWLYHRFCLSFRDAEDLLSQRGITVSYEAIRLWCLKFGPEYARRVKRRQGRLGDAWHLDEVFVTIQGRRQNLWRAVDQDGDMIDILVQPRRDQRAAKRFFRKPSCAKTRPTEIARQISGLAMMMLAILPCRRPKNRLTSGCYHIHICGDNFMM